MEMETNLETIVSMTFDKYSLLRACRSATSEYALFLISLEEFDYGLVDGNGMTALSIAISYGHSDVALALIKTGKAKPENVDLSGKTALIRACQRKMTDVALELINTGSSNPTHIIPELGYSAIEIALHNEMKEVDIAIGNRM